ncbi:MAG TPA: hypothetical protein VLA61_13450 [Ideonella sp.]|uniref:hypothetical protein n=1 Tax=Ideonella sp. TaxID=1929293 RepID=UPI002C2568D5|nr:hypothetical protein [Ideonella sp.]HSI49273.1 hypothetical protein [Ideonella sp.]
MRSFALLTAAPHPRLTLALATLALAAGLTACGKVQEVATQKATEKMIESSINKDGNTNAKVDLGNGGMKVEGQDEHGKAFKMEMGSAQISEKDLGLPFYPGAKPADNKGTRIVNGEGMMMQVELTSSDDPKKVSDWYRAQLKASQADKLVMDQGKEKGMTLSISDTKAESNVMVDVSDDGSNGSHISLMYSAKTKAGT